MDLTCYERQVLSELCDYLKASVVTVRKFDEMDNTMKFFTGFVIYSDRTESLICVTKRVLEGDQDLFVHFSDGSYENVTELLLRNSESGHAVLVVRNSTGPRSMVSFSSSAVERENILTIAEDEHGFALNMIPGTVFATSCSSINKSGNDVGGSGLFAMRCPAVAQTSDGRQYEQQIIGCAVFDFDGLVIGTIDSLDEDGDAYDLKYAKHAHLYVDNLESLLKAKQNKEAEADMYSLLLRQLHSGAKAAGDGFSWLADAGQLQWLVRPVSVPERHAKSWPMNRFGSDTDPGSKRYHRAIVALYGYFLAFLPSRNFSLRFSIPSNLLCW